MPTRRKPPANPNGDLEPGVRTSRDSGGRTAGKGSSPSPPLAPAARAMQRLGLVRDIDLALHVPLRYEDETRVVSLDQVLDGEVAQVEVTVDDCRVEFRPRRQLIARAHDGHGQALTLRFLNFYPSQQRQMSAGAKLRVRGELRGGFFGREMVHPQVKTAASPLPTTLTPVYPSTTQLPQASLRKAIDEALQREALTEVLPALCVPARLPRLREAVLALHHPSPHAAVAALQDKSHPAWQRLKFEELLAQQLSQLAAKATRTSLCAPKLPAQPHGLRARLLAVLPFALTRAQHRVVRDIEDDLTRSTPMHRLLQGDVGSGKTVVAAVAAAAAIDNGWQCALMAPTEILAEQHFKKLVEWLEPLGIQVAWLTGSRKGRARAPMLAAVESGQAQLVVGTHAVIQSSVRFAKLGLAIVDEQHRFGVAQRLALRSKLEVDGTPSESADAAKLEPHLLMMSATPIPRTLAMTYFADLDISTIDELPPGRSPIVTKLFADSKRDAVIARIHDEVKQGRQVYWVCPLIEESEELDLRNATHTHEELTQHFAGHMIGLLHGRMPANEKAAVMSLFASGAMPLVVATTVIEVGVDVPNASLMVIEHAERFGLSQLHQLRGRVGRGAVASVCVLLYTPPLSPSGRERLKAMVETTDGFEIARRDLAIRGPGELLGARQSGDALLRFADLQDDSALLQHARQVAPIMAREHAAASAAHVDRWLGSRAEFIKA